MILLDIYSIGLWLTYALIAIAFFGMILGISLAVFQNLKEGGLVAIGGFVGLIVLFFIGYAMSSSEVPAEMQPFIESTGYKLSSGGLITFYVLGVVSFLLMILGLAKSVVTGN